MPSDNQTSRALPPDDSGRFSRLDPEESARLRRTQIVKPHPVHRTLEIVLFSVSGVIVVLALLALYSSWSPDYKRVPNHVADGLKQDRVNILLIGVGGDRHPGGGRDLADTLMLISVKPSTKQVAIVSIPRDLYVRIGRYGTHRINSAHAIGDSSGFPGGGPALTMTTVSEIFQQPIHAFARVDFAAFEKLVDAVGGVDICVQRPFYDYLFRDGFQQGCQHMNGKRALAYARYRYVIGPEGDNFARELRQQQVVAALRQKLQNMSAADVVRIATALKTLSNYTETNLTPSQVAVLYRDFRRTPPGRIRHVSLKPFTTVFDLASFTEPGEAVRTRTGDFRELRDLERNIFAGSNQVGSPDEIRIAESPVMRNRAAAMNLD